MVLMRRRYVEARRLTSLCKAKEGKTLAAVMHAIEDSGEVGIPHVGESEAKGASEGFNSAKDCREILRSDSPLSEGLQYTISGNLLPS